MFGLMFYIFYSNMNFRIVNCKVLPDLHICLALAFVSPPVQHPVLWVFMYMYLGFGCGYAKHPFGQ